jgi:hypothetical protein
MIRDCGYDLRHGQIAVRDAVPRSTAAQFSQLVAQWRS